MNVRLDCGLGERLEFSPCPLAEPSSVELKLKRPFFKSDLRRGSGRNPVAQTLLLSSRPEAAGNRGLVHAGGAFASLLLPGCDQA
jgi:hypothetical protein